MTTPVTTVEDLASRGAYPWQGNTPVGAPWANGGNSFGADASLGLNDAHTISFKRLANNFLTYDGTTLTLGLLSGVQAVNVSAGSGGIIMHADTGSIVIQVVDVGHITIDNSSNGSDPIRIFAGTNIDMTATGSLEVVALLGAAITDGVSLPSPDASALLDLQSTDRGFLGPRMTTIQRNAIATPAKFLQIDNTTTGQPEINMGTTGTPVWAAMAAQYGGPIALTNGVVQVSNVYLTSASVILVSVGSPVPGAGNLTIRYDVLNADRTNGAGNGSFKISALNAAGTLQNLDQSTNVRWTIVGQ